MSWTLIHGGLDSVVLRSDLHSIVRFDRQQHASQFAMIRRVNRTCINRGFSGTFTVLGSAYEADMKLGRRDARRMIPPPNVEATRHRSTRLGQVQAHSSHSSHMSYASVVVSTSNFHRFLFLSLSHVHICLVAADREIAPSTRRRPRTGDPLLPRVGSGTLIQYLRTIYPSPSSSYALSTTAETYCSSSLGGSIDYVPCRHDPIHRCCSQGSTQWP